MTRFKVERPAPFVKQSAGYFTVKTVVEPVTPIAREDTPITPIMAPHNPWTVTDVSYKSFIPLDTPRKNPKTGKMEKTMVVFHHIIEVSRDTWPAGTHLTIKRHRGNITVNYPNGQKDRGMSRTMAGYEMGKRFGESVAREILTMI